MSFSVSIIFDFSQCHHQQLWESSHTSHCHSCSHSLFQVLAPGELKCCKDFWIYFLFLVLPISSSLYTTNRMNLLKQNSDCVLNYLWKSFNGHIICQKRSKLLCVARTCQSSFTVCFCSLSCTVTYTETLVFSILTIHFTFSPFSEHQKALVFPNLCFCH